MVPLLCQVLQETLVVQQTLHALYAGLTSAEHSLGLRHEFPLPPGSLNGALHLDQQRLERIFESRFSASRRLACLPGLVVVLFCKLKRLVGLALNIFGLTDTGFELGKL